LPWRFERYRAPSSAARGAILLPGLWDALIVKYRFAGRSTKSTSLQFNAIRDGLELAQ
jgi:hypothetical protein